MLTRDSHELFLRFFPKKNHLGPFGIRGRGCCRCTHLLAGKELEEDVEREKGAVFLALMREIVGGGGRRGEAIKHLTASLQLAMVEVVVVSKECAECKHFPAY